MPRGALGPVHFVLFGVIAAITATAGGCGDYGPVTLASDPNDGGEVRARGVNEACDDASRCRTGLVCKDAKCAPGRSLDEGASCVISGECKDGLYCGPMRKCARGGRKAAGESCGSEAECGAALRCNAVGLSAECQPEGAADVSAACKIGSDCFGGLLCAGGKCVAPPATTGAPPVAVSSFAGVACQDDASPTVKAYFRVPRGKDDGDFFRLPFPNDVRKKGGKVDLSGFPTPGADVLGYDLVDRWARYVEETATGFSAYPTIVMRFSATPDLATLKAAGVLRMVDITTPGGSDIGFGWSATSTKTKYVCANAITARPAPGIPLEAGHTYTLFVTNGAKGPGGAAIEVAADLKALVGAADPGAPLSQGWASYAPLRAWAAAASVDLGTIVNATVFTVGKHADVMGKVAAAVDAGPAPAASGWIKCGGAVPSPCPQLDGTRACGAVDPAFDELHALVTLTNFQKGTAPYRTPATDGDVVLDPSGTPTAQGSSQVCLLLTVPKNGAMPAQGWPLAIHSHGTGGNFRSAITDGLAKRFAAADGGAAKIAVLAIDQVAHGTRRGGTTARPEQLWFVTSNPRAMRGYQLQAAADVLSLVRLAPSITFAAATSPTGADIKLGDVILVGHGQGANAVALAAPRAPALVKGVVMGGIGASFVDTVPGKKNPVDFLSVAPAILGEITVTKTHPVLGMFQNALDQVDPLDHATLLATAPPVQARHAFAVYGRSDSFTPEPTQSAYTFAAALGIAQPPQSVGSPDNIGEPVIPVPAGGNFATDITAIVRQYDKGSYDGHLVMFQNDDAARDIERFVADVATGKIPMVGR